MKTDPEWYLSPPQSIDAQGQPCGPTGPVSVPSWTPAVDRSAALRPPEGNVEKKEPVSPPRSPGSSPPLSPSACRHYPYTMQRTGTDTQEAYENKHSLRPTPTQQDSSSPSHYGATPSLDQPTTAQAPQVERLEEQRGGGGVEEYSGDPWRITAEQQEYYTHQFRTLQPDLGALILGAVAKNFFTKSKLPIPELSHIWELSDVDRDGALAFSEFCTAFHLIVARKNGYPLPETLPPTLRSGLLQHGYPLPETLPPTLRSGLLQQSAPSPGHPESTEPLITFEDTGPRASQLEKNNHVEILNPQPGSTTSKQDSREETKFIPKRVAVSQDATAYPDRPEPPHELDPQMRWRTRPRSYSSTSIDDAMKKTEEPPTPPPRPQKTHSRASSLDLNKLFQQSSQGMKSSWLPHPPALPPRPLATQVPHLFRTAESPKKTVLQPNFADFSRYREEEETGVKPEKQSPQRRSTPSTEDLSLRKQEVTGVSPLQAPQKPARRKYRPDSQNLDGTPLPTTPSLPPVTTTKPAQKLLSKQKREIQTAIRRNKESNAVLTRLNSELQQQLKEIHQERITLESQLDILRPLTSA